MKIYDITDADGRPVAFEISNLCISRRGVARVVRQRLPQATVVREPAPALTAEAWRWWAADEHFCEFQVGATRFVAWEPWGDSSRYWIGPEPAGLSSELPLVREAFARTRVIDAVLPTIVVCGWLALAVLGHRLTQSGVGGWCVLGGAIMVLLLLSFILWRSQQSPTRVHEE
jgi:hypothetical protein